ncbi:MAG: heavy metal-responsive transcriptional regulator [Planctomycetota bacterium]|nr:MAG: heavy metal-responsive transcriptional regulator [Planctomycetota bacterium]
MDTLTIGKVARQAGVGVETIRFYEREGLVEEPARRASGYRQYDPEVVRRVRFIRHAKELGFTLREIKELLELRVEPGCHCGDVLELAEAKIADIDERIRKLRKMRRALAGLTRDCKRGRPTDECPILKALDQPNGKSS